MDSETLRFISQEIARQLNVVLSASTGTTTAQTENIDNLFPGMPTIPSRPVMHPYGLVSRAPKNTINVVGRVGEHFGNRMVLGHRDKDRPDLESGETILYNQWGQQIYLDNGHIRIGKKATSNPAVVGNEMKAFLLALIDWTLNHTHIVTAPGSPSQVPFTAADLSAIQAAHVDNDMILSQRVFIEKPQG